MADPNKSILGLIMGCSCNVRGRMKSSCEIEICSCGKSKGDFRTPAGPPGTCGAKRGRSNGESGGDTSDGAEEEPLLYLVFSRFVRFLEKVKLRDCTRMLGRRLSFLRIPSISRSEVLIFIFFGLCFLLVSKLSLASLSNFNEVLQENETV